MIEIRASVPCAAPPAWAVLERHLLALLDQAVHPYLGKYTRPDGTLIWDHSSAHSEDDFYEAFYNWPLLYLMGGDDSLRELSGRQWEAVTRQLTGYGLVHKEYARSDDQFHQGESDIYFYLLCLADPQGAGWAERARRFAGLYMGEDPEAPNWDPQQKLIRAPRNGSGGPANSFFRGEPSYGWSPGMARYGLPHYDVPGIDSIEDLKDPLLARRMGEYMERRMSRGDVAANLAVCSLVTNAFLLTGEEQYRRWVLDYVEVWMERARGNQGLLPDNVGLSGQVGEYIERGKMELELRQSRARLNFVLNRLPIVLYAAEPSTPYRTTWVSVNAMRITGFPPRRFVEDPAFWASRIHPEDRAAVEREFSSGIERGVITTEYRAIGADGSCRHCTASSGRAAAASRRRARSDGGRRFTFTCPAWTRRPCRARPRSA